MLLWAYTATLLNTTPGERKTKEEVPFKLWPEGWDNMYKAKCTHGPLLFDKLAPFYKPKITIEFTGLLYGWNYSDQQMKMIKSIWFYEETSVLLVKEHVLT